MFSKLIGTHKVPSAQQKYERFPRGQQSSSPKKGLLPVTPENNGLFALYTPDMGILRFASMRNIAAIGRHLRFSRPQPLEKPTVLTR